MCYGVNLCFGIGLCHGVSQVYGANPCYVMVLTQVSEYLRGLRGLSAKDTKDELKQVCSAQSQSEGPPARSLGPEAEGPLTST